MGRLVQHRRLFGLLGLVPPAEFEQAYYRSLGQEGVEGVVPEGPSASRSSIVEALRESISGFAGQDDVESRVSISAVSKDCQSSAVMGAALS